MITETKDKEYILTDHLIIHFLELPKLKDKEISSKIVRWLLYFREEGRGDDMLKILLESDEDLKTAHDMYQAFNSNKKLRTYALSREKAERDKLYFKNLAARKEAEGLEIGLKRGMERGLEQGLEQGELRDKHHVLIRQLEIKFSLSEDEKKHILSVMDFNKLDAALNAVVLATNKENVLKLL